MHPIDKWLSCADNALKTVSGSYSAGRPYPGADRPETATEEPLDASQRRLAGALMRVNHVGEVCAQALYNAQNLANHDPELQQQFEQAARGEADHLAWTQRRLQELGDRPSLLNPLWYAGAFTIGLVAGRLGRSASLGFVVETERQVERHLQSHLDRLPEADRVSRRVVEQMKADEAQHADAAAKAGAADLPYPVKLAMRAAARVMTRTAHHI